MIDTAPLFAPLHRELIDLLRGVSADDWLRPTVAGTWRVRDVAAHLLDGDLRKLAAHRDGHMLASEGQYPDVVTLINSLNASGVSYATRLSPRLLIDLLDITGRWVSELTERLDPSAIALFPVAWAGEDESRNWMDTGREYTERWHHQMQIRDAVGAPLLLDDKWYEPLLAYSALSLPRAYAAVSAPVGTCVNVEIADSPWSWHLVRDPHAWSLHEGPAAHPAATVRLERTTAWRLFYNADGAVVSIEGPRELGEPVLTARSVMV